MTVQYNWYDSQVKDYTLKIYSKFSQVNITNSTGASWMYHMDGKSPSGFINSTYCGIDCLSRAPAGIIQPYPQALENSTNNNDDNNNNDPGN